MATPIFTIYTSPAMILLCIDALTTPPVNVNGALTSSRLPSNPLESILKQAFLAVSLLTNVIMIIVTRKNLEGTK